MKKATVTQELVNTYPSWSKVRTDDQSLGYQVLNTFGNQLEELEKQLQTIRANQYITTANLDEIDITFRLKMDADFEFDEDNTDPLNPVYDVPEVSGLIDGTWHDVAVADNNDIETFWYTSIPNRITLDYIVSGEDHELVSFDGVDATVTGVFDHHLGGGRIWVEATGGIEYLKFEEGLIHRSKVVIEGETRKGTTETETLIFPWDMKQHTLQEWKTITSISVFEMEDDVTIDIRSADFNTGPYISPWNLRYATSRNKIDEFWDLGHNGSIPTLDRIEYQADEWEQLVVGFSSKDVRESWELLEETTNIVSGVDITISGVDMAIQPFSDRVWVATADNKLFLYDLRDDMVSGIEELKDNTPGAHIQFDYDFDRVLLGEDIQFVPWHARPLKEIQSYRLWYQQPDGTKYGLLDGAQVSFTSNFTQIVASGTLLTRSVENIITIPTTQRGEYLVVFEATFVDGEEQRYSRIFSTRHKSPLVTLDLSSIVPTPIDGIDFDTDQRLWVKSGNDYYRINLHTDVMLIDYENKVFYFKEEYEEVGIDTNG